MNKSILFFYQYFGTPKGSWSTRVYELTRRWVKSGNTVTVVTAPYDKSDIRVSSFISKMELEGIKLIVIDSGDSNRFSKFKRMFRSLQFSLISIYYALSLKYDVCIASSGPITIGLPMVFAKRFRRKPTIFEVRDLWPAGAIELGIIQSSWQRKTALWFERICYKSANKVVCASIGQRNYIAKRNPGVALGVIPNASDLELFGKISKERLPKWASKKILFTHIGSLGLIHNTNYWMEVSRELDKIDKENRISLVFIGDGVDRERLLAEKKRDKLQNIHFLGLKPKAELPVWVQNSRATLFATLDNLVQSTCSPNKIFDSFAAGVPIIQTSNGWIKDLVEKNNCGINVSLNSPKEAAEKILWLSLNENIAKEMGKNAFRLAQGEFNRDILAEKYLSFLDEITV
ncbi:glycosyltransferase family 4 protein [Cyclobacterium jeungdonense]|uniref:Glycosyltransferase family 4 protein n=2 Tax=Cyclobacterium jeungdonense TaxID=708087 RepID=A0ABT8C9M9_9BACT|nr:glycosyltransferase family 4 protein [Cyclobacterium jeungdonense]MDN3689479.1 glycosyltransferase family 4 protein [Cyclobacterium jeungdonense]